MENFKNQTVIITGAGSGMGRAMAELFAKQGANVVAADTREDRLSLVNKQITEFGGIISTLKCNVANEHEAAELVNHAVNKFKRIDILINNAGIMDDFMPVAELSTDLWNKVMGVNINGPFYTCRAAIQYMLKQGKGCIINIASVGGFCGSRAGVAYTASKHALIGMTKNIGYIYAKKGIRCNAIAPGAVETNIGEGMKPNQFAFSVLSPGFQTIPGTGKPEEIAEIALFLAGAKSNFINGSVVTADGGWTAY